MTTRQTTGLVESLPRLVGLDWTVPAFAGLSPRQKTLAANIPRRGPKAPCLDSPTVGHRGRRRVARTQA